MRKHKNTNFTNNYSNTRKIKYRKKAGKISGNSAERKKKALVKINKATLKLKRKKEACPICFENIKKKDRVETTCGHFFHKNCLQGWCIQKVKEDILCFCPVCKTDLILQTREAKNKIAEKKRLENKPVVLSPAARERIRLAREQRNIEFEQSRRNVEQGNRELEEIQRRREERALRRTQRQQAEANQ
tara:strand:+ start:5421 stop:5984 length:564 start_codon:yes stop_codon:yes gene_type:complete